jgi:eukaryotic-like serine/threonine-protein kinase
MLTAGHKLGPYEILSSLGAGGMGEVYRARDTRLERDVAVKVLPANLSSDANLKQRLEREAKSVSKLAHPHICTLHDIGHDDGLDYLVMELVEGETLEQRLIRGPLPPDQTLRIASQIADALAKAHKLGITHRDLKPSNIMVTKSGAKLMDFGLAKQSGPAPLAQALTEMTVEQAKLTSEGMLVGTFQYMAPEQLEGKDADARADIFALGEVIYEMATGKPAFAGKSRASLIAAILTADPPPITQLQPLAPPTLERIVRKCLAKDPDDRWQSAADLAAELKWVSEAGSQATSASSTAIERRAKRLNRISWLVAAACLFLLIVGAVIWWNLSNRKQPTQFFHASLPFSARDLAIAPNGQTVAIVAYSHQLNNYALWTYDIGSRRAISLDGTLGASYPFWSPDSKSIGFFAEGKLKRIDVGAGPIQVLCDAPNGRGGTWNKEDTIIFAPDALAGLSTVSSLGGTPTELTKPDTASSESSHRWPIFLPDGKHFLYLAINFSLKRTLNTIFIGSLKSPEKHLIVHSGSNVVYVAPYLLYLRDKTLVAQQLEPDKFELIGEPRTLSDETLVFSQIGRAVFDATPQVLLEQAGSGIDLSELIWVDRKGRELTKVGHAAWYDNIQISPDGQKLATDRTDPDDRNTDVWILDLSRDTTTRLTFDPALDISPVWVGNTRLLFTSNRSFEFRLYSKNADGSGSDEDISAGGTQQFIPVSASRDGKFVLVRKTNHLWYLALPDRNPKSLIAANWVLQSAQFSPDGRWMAYASNESGRMEVYVSPFPSVNAKWQVSTNGGSEPRWRHDGKELFFLAPDATLMATPVTFGVSFQAGTPVPLFQLHPRISVASFDLFSYDVSTDGQRFLVANKIDQTNAVPVSVVLNWTSALQK